MKKKNIAKLAMLGLASGMLIGCQQPANGNGNGKANGNGNGNGNGNPHGNGNGNGSQMEQTAMSQKERDFNKKLNNEGQKTFETLTSAQRETAMKVAESKCKGQNDCKGLGGCKTNGHSCKGQNSCKGQGGCAVKDPNVAVDLVHKKG